MNVEQFDEVNIRDEVIGTTNKQEAHTTGKLHRVAAVYVFTQGGKLYVQAHKRDGKWDHSVGGHVQKGETYAQGAAREASEELGITQPLTELAVGLHGEEYAHEQHLFGLYKCTVPEGWEFVPNEEVNDIFPMTVEEIETAMATEPETRFTRGFRITMAEYLRQQAD